MKSFKYLIFIFFICSCTKNLEFNEKTRKDLLEINLNQLQLECALLENEVSNLEFISPDSTKNFLLEIRKIYFQLELLNEEIPKSHSHKLTPIHRHKYKQKLDDIKKSLTALEFKFDLLEVKLDAITINNNPIENKKKLIKGQIAYRIQDSMIVNSLSRIAMTISDKKILKDSINKTIQDLTIIGNKPKSTKQDIKIENIKIGEKMRARLIDPQAPSYPAFNINALSNEMQHVDLNDEKLTSWQWDVYPLKVGDYILNLVVDVVILTESKETQTTIPVFDKEITVSSGDTLNNKDEKIWTIEFILSCIIILILSVIFALCLHLRYKKKSKNLGEFLKKDSLKNLKEQEIKNLIKKGKIEKALDLIEEYVKNDDEMLNQVIIHKSRLSNLKQRNDIGESSNEEISMGKVKINLALLKILEEVKNSD